LDFQNGIRSAATPSHSPGFDGTDDLDHPVVFVEEDRVDGEPHEAGVDGSATGDQQSTADFKPGSPHETDGPFPERVRDFEVAEQGNALLEGADFNGDVLLSHKVAHKIRFSADFHEG